VRRSRESDRFEDLAVRLAELANRADLNDDDRAEIVDLGAALRRQHRLRVPSLWVIGAVTLGLVAIVFGLALRREDNGSASTPTTSDSAAPVPAVSLKGTNFARADLPGVHLPDVDLSEVCFAGANLEGAVLTGANLDGADLQGASLVGANLNDVVGAFFYDQTTDFGGTAVPQGGVEYSPGDATPCT
jgi:Pentapeptide repeats (8 copies)